MKELNCRQKAFADYYIESGNAEESAIKAGYSKGYARGNAHKLVANNCISQYIDERMKKIDEKRIASGDEVLQFLSSTMRGEVRDQFGLDPSLSDRIVAAKELAKRTVDVNNKKTNSDIIKNMKVLADLILNPLEDRDISDFE